MAAKRTAARIPRESGSELLIDAAIRLARTQPIAQVTVRDIASDAGLQTMHLKRYFGSRNGLLVAVSNRLMENIVTGLAERPLNTMWAYLGENEDVALRLRIVNHLLDDGVPPGEFTNDKDSYLRIAERIATVNKVGTRTARAYALVIQLVLQGDRLMGEVNGLSSRDRQDIFSLLVTLSAGLANAESTLHW